MVARSSAKRQVFVQDSKVYVFNQKENKYVTIDAVSLIELVNSQPTSATIQSVELAHAKIDYLINNLK